MTKSIWWIYLIRTHHNQLYTGITTDVARRFQQHQESKGAKFLRGKQPLTLEWQSQARSHSHALRLEIAIKKWSKRKKEQLIQGSMALPCIEDEDDEGGENE